MQCNNAKLTNIREVFIYKLNQINHSFSYFNNQDLFIYILAMKDKSINNLVAKYCFDVQYNTIQYNKTLFKHGKIFSTLIKYKKNNYN
jgi:hypothetical protein